MKTIKLFFLRTVLTITLSILTVISVLLVPANVSYAQTYQDSNDYLSTCKKEYAMRAKATVFEPIVYLKSLPCSKDTCPDSQTLATLFLGEKVIVTAVIENSVSNIWYRVIAREKVGYVYSGDVTPIPKVNWSQGSSTWKKYKGINWSSACAVVSIAIQIGRSGLVEIDEKADKIDTKTMSGFNPMSFAKLAKDKNVVASSSKVNDWTTIDTVIPGFKHEKDSKYGKKPTAFSYYPAKSKQDIIKAMAYYLSMGYYPIVEGPGSTWSKNGGRHYVAVIAATASDVRVIDPRDGKEKSLFSVGSGNNAWTYKNIEKCGNPTGYGCCVLYSVDLNKVLYQ